jgi:hypothetical protein
MPPNNSWRAHRIALAGPLMDLPTPSLVDLLRSTLHRLEQSPGIDPRDPRFLELKATILRSIAELEVRRQEAA